MDIAQKRALYAVYLVLSIVLWMVLFTFGVHVNTRPIRNNWGSTGTISLINFLVILLCWTWSNLMILCCTCAVIGELGRTFVSSRSKIINIRSAIIKGFLVYLLALTGQLVAVGTLPGDYNQTNPLLMIDAAYFRFAGFVSLISFMVGYSPRLFSNMMERIEHLTEIDIEEEGKTPEDREAARPQER